MKELVSVVVPVFNEEDNIPLLYEELKSAFAGLGNPYEIIFVDDGSTDKSRKLIEQISVKDPGVKGIVFRRNFGQTSAIAAGIAAARGEYIMTIDADLQNDPKDIGRLLEKLREGYDLVSGWRRDRKEPFFSRRLPSITANSIISAMTGLKLHDYGCTLKVYRRELIKNVNLYGEMHRFIPVYIHWLGGRIAEVEVNHRQRKWGKSKYGLGRTLKVILDLITVKFLLGSYSTSPLYFFGGWGVFLAGAGILGAVVTLAQKFIWGYWVHKNPLLLLSVFAFVLGTQIIFIGLLAELSVRIYYESTKKPTYIVHETFNC